MGEAQADASSSRPIHGGASLAAPSTLSDPEQRNPEDAQAAERPTAAPAFVKQRAARRAAPDPGSRSAAMRRFFARDLWAMEVTTLPTMRRALYAVTRVLQLTCVNFVKDRCTWRASALTYISVLSLVPLLALAFSVAKGMGAYETLLDQTIKPFLDSTFGEAAGPEDGAPVSQVREAIDTMLGFVQSTNVSRLGLVGFLIVFWTVIRLLSSIEHAFNDIWGVQRARSLPRKLADYFSTVVLVPLLLVAGTGALGVVRTEIIDGPWSTSPGLALFGSLAIVWAAFTVAYLFMPNTQVRFSSALLGGVVGGTMWQLFQVAHLKLQMGVANYNAIYSTFAALPIFLVWVQSSWMTVLLGAEAAAAHQNEERHGQLVQSRDYDLALKEVVALRLAVRVTRAFLGALPPRTVPGLAAELACPERVVGDVARSLEHAHILAQLDSGEGQLCYVLAADPSTIHMQDVLDALKGDSILDSTRAAFLAVDAEDAAVDGAFERFRRTRDQSASNLSLAELAQLDDEAARGAPRAVS